MPHVNRSPIDPGDEIKVYQCEGEDEEEQKSSVENLTEVKSSLVTEGEEKSSVQIPIYNPPKNVETTRALADRSLDERSSLLPLPPPGQRYGYFSPPPFSFYPHPNAALSMVNRVPLVPSNHHAPPYLMSMYSPEFQPPPAHIGIPPMQVDPKTGIRAPVYPLPHPSQFHGPMFSPEFAHQFPWQHSSLNHNSHHHHHHGNSSMPPQQHNQNSNSMQQQSPGGHHRSERSDKKKDHIKKPLNAFMLFMKEQRAQVVADSTLKESAAINQLLGKKWHSLSREEQSKYYEMAKKERQQHMQLYPGWTARDNYAINAKKKKRKKDKSQEADANNPKKCRARFGLDRQSSWCKPCRRKKKCIRYISGSDNNGESEDNIGSVDSLGSLEVPTPDSRFGDDNNSDSDSGNGDVDDELEVSSEFSISSPPVLPLPNRDMVQSTDPLLGSPASQLFTVQHLSRSAACLGSPETPPSTDSSSTTTTAPLHAVT